MPKANGKTRTHFEQIPVAVVERIAIADAPESRDADRRISDIPEVTPVQFQERRAADRRRSSATMPSPPGKES